jgi:hypothetical protein
VRRRRLDVWSDERNVVGEDWRAQLQAAIDCSSLALVLVSPDLLASDFIMGQELPALQAAGAGLVFVLVRPALWQHEPALEQVQWAHDPRRDGPLAACAAPEGQIVRVCERVIELIPPATVIKDVEIDHAAPAFSISRPATEPLAPAGVLGELSGVPPAPPAYIVRDELAELRAALLDVGDGAVGLTGATVGFQGQGGIGKTVLAAALARDETVRRHFPDGIYWLTLGQSADIVGVQIELLQRLGAPMSP